MRPRADSVLAVCMTTNPLTPTGRATRSPGKAAKRDRRFFDPHLAGLTSSLLRRLLADTANPMLRAALHRAASEAESLAWLTPAPLLVLPILLEEKARAARFYSLRQAELREASREWFSLSE